MTPMPLGLFVKKLQPKVGLAGYDILFAYFVVEAKSKNQQKKTKIPKIPKLPKKNNNKNIL